MPVQPEDLNVVVILGRVFATRSPYHYAYKINDAPGNVGTMKTCNGKESSAKKIAPKGIATKSKTRIDQVGPFVYLAAQEYHSTQDGQQQKVPHSP